MKVGSALPESAFHTHRRFATTRTDPSCARTLGSSLAFRPLRRMTRPSKEGPPLFRGGYGISSPFYQVMDPERLRHSRPARLAAPRAGLLCRPLLPDVLFDLVVAPERLHQPRLARLAAPRAGLLCRPLLPDVLLRLLLDPEHLHPPRPLVLQRGVLSGPATSTSLGSLGLQRRALGCFAVLCFRTSSFTW